MKKPSPYDLFTAGRQDVIKQQWLASALQDYAEPTSLAERNWVQLMLADRYALQFQVDRYDAVMVVAKVYGARFPH